MTEKMQCIKKASQNPSLKPANARLLQRQCACGQHAIGGYCEECSKEKGVFQRASFEIMTNSVPPIVHELLRSPGQLLDIGNSPFMKPRLGHDFSQMPVHPTKGVTIQPKLVVSQPGDHYEKEADRVADIVTRMPASQTTAGEVMSQLTQPLYIQRLGPEDEEKLHQSPEEEEEEEGDEALQAKEVPGRTSMVSIGFENYLQSIRGGGEPLPRPVRSFFEPRFGHDFSQVRIHANSEATKSAQRMNARAYTVSHDIVFGLGEYSPGTDKGRLLLAHELAHVIQQSSASPGASGLIMRGKGKAIQKIAGWIVRVGERKLIKKAAIYTEKEMAKLLGNGYNVLVRRGRSVAKRVAKKVWGDDVIHHTGHIIKKTTTKGMSHFQPGKHLIGKSGEKGWHIFYAAAPILFFSEDVEALEIYDDKYPGKSIANYLTVTKYVGEDSWLSYLDWVNPLELIAIGGDIGRDKDRERTKELKAIVFNRIAADGTIQTYELDLEGQLVRVIIVKPGGQQKTLSAEEYYTFLAKNAVKSSPEPVIQDGTKHPNYASTFDAEYRIYNSKQGWGWDFKTLSFFLPAEDSKKLQKIGQFYVWENFSIKYVYAYVHPRYRVELHQPGFEVPEELVGEYASSRKDAFLQNMLKSTLQAKKVLSADLWKAK